MPARLFFWHGGRTGGLEAAAPSAGAAGSSPCTPGPACECACVFVCLSAFVCMRVWMGVGVSVCL